MSAPAAALIPDDALESACRAGGQRAPPCWRARCARRPIRAPAWSRTGLRDGHSPRIFPIVVGPSCSRSVGRRRHRYGAQRRVFSGFDLTNRRPLAMNYLDPDVGPRCLSGVQCISAMCCPACRDGGRRTVLVAIRVRTAIVSLYFCAAYIAAYPALLDGGMFCDLAQTHPLWHDSAAIVIIVTVADG